MSETRRGTASPRWLGRNPPPEAGAAGATAETVTESATEAPAGPAASGQPSRNGGKSQTASSQWRLFTNPEFVVLWAAMLVSSAGTFFLLLTVSALLLTQHGSGLGASAVFGFQWILPIALVSVVRRSCETTSLRSTVVSSELLNGAISLSVGFLLSRGLVAAVLAGFLLRGLLEAITKTGRVVYAKELFQGPDLKLASYTFNNSYLLGGALGGVLGTFVVAHVSIITAGAIDAATFVFSACCYLWLRDVSVARHLQHSRGHMMRRVREALRGRRELTLAVLYIILGVGVFQGFHNAARVIIPIRVLHNGQGGVMQLQIVSCAALFLGAVAVPLILRWVRADRYLNFAVTAAAAAGMALLPQVRSVVGSYALYFAFIFLFEFCFTAAQGTIVQHCPISEMVPVTSFYNAGGTGLMVICTLLAGGLSDVGKFGALAVVLAVAAVAVALLWEGIPPKPVTARAP